MAFRGEEDGKGGEQGGQEERQGQEGEEGGGAVYSDTNGVPRVEGRTLHVDVGEGALAQRVVTCGTVSRARALAARFDNDGALSFEHMSSRGFHSFTGTVNGTPVSVVAIGMGFPMADFLVREVRAVSETDKPMAFVRLGTCGGVSDDAAPGSVVVCTDGSGMVVRNPDAFAADAADADAYHMFNLAPADEELSRLLVEELEARLPAGRTLQGANVTADTFYSAQGRIDPQFEDKNADLLDKVRERYPTAKSMEMETFQLLHLADCSRPRGSIRASAAAIVVANRPSGEVVSEEDYGVVEPAAADAVLHAIAKLSL